MAIFDFPRPNIPHPRYQQIDTAALAQAMAAPEVARQQAKTGLWQTVAGLPGEIMEARRKGKEYKMTEATKKMEMQQTAELFPLQKQRLEAQIEAEKSLAKQRSATALRQLKIATTAQKEPDIFADAIKSLSGNVLFQTTLDPEQRQVMIEQEIDLVRVMREKAKGKPTPNPHIPTPAIPQLKTAEDVRKKFGF